MLRDGCVLECQCVPRALASRTGDATPAAGSGSRHRLRLSSSLRGNRCERLMRTTHGAVVAFCVLVCARCAHLAVLM